MKRIVAGRALWVASLVAIPGLGLTALPAHAQQAAPLASAAAPAAPAPVAPSGWSSNIKLSAQVEGGISIAPERPADGENFGQLFTDHANQFQLDQVLLTLARPTDPKATGYDFGFKFQALYGSDARYAQFTGELNSTFATRYQLAFVEANVDAHLPWLTAGGIDAKLGQFASPLGYETIDPSGSPFYSHSYIFNFGVPFVQAGLLTVTHATPTVDVYLGVDRGENTSFGAADNNSSAAATFGFALNLLGGNLTLQALSHVGPENPSRTVPGANANYRYLNDLVVTYKATPKLSFTTELNLARDDGFRANAFGVAQYASYNLTDTLGTEWARRSLPRR